MTDHDLSFVSRGGQIWAIWRDGKPAIGMGDDTEVSQAMVRFLQEQTAQVVSGAPAVPKASPVSSPVSPSALLKPVSAARDRESYVLLGLGSACAISFLLAGLAYCGSL